MMNERKLDDIIPISVRTFEKYIAHTDDHVWFGILSREMWDKKHTVKGWFDTLAELKKR